jgi:hypothetical protein
MSNIVVSLHAHTFLLTSATCASLPLTPLEQREDRGVQVQRLRFQLPSDTLFVFALFNLFTRNQFSALQQRSVIQIEHVQLNLATTNMRRIQLLGLETTRYTGVYVQKNFGAFAPEPPRGLATIHSLFSLNINTDM